MAEVKAPYTQPQTYQLFTDTYLRTHRQRMDEALQMAMMELQNQKDLLAYYQKAEKNLTDYMEKVGTAGTGGKLSNKEFEQFMRVLAIEQKTNQALNDDIAKAISDVNKEYLVPQGATGSINTQAAQGAANLAKGLPAVKTAAKAVTGYSKSTNQAMAAAIAFYQQLEMEAANKGTTSNFNAIRGQIAQEISQIFGVQSQGGATVIQNPQAFETAKQNALNQRKAETAKRTLTKSQIKDAYQRAGITPSQETTSKTSETAKEQESLFASRIKTLQKKQDELEQKIAKSATAEGIYGRQTEIYNNRYRQTAKMRGQSKAIEDAMRKLSPQQIYLMEAMEATANVKENPYFATGEEKGDIVQAKQLMDAMIKNKGSGKPLDVVALSSKLAAGNETKAKKILGMAINGVVAHAQEQNPTKQIEEAQKDAQVVEATQLEIDKAQTDAEKAKAERDALTLDSAAPLEQPEAKFNPLQPPEGLATVPPTAETTLFEERIDMATQPQVQQPELNKNYLTGEGWGYVFTKPDTVRFVKKDGSIVGTFGKDTAQYEEAMKIFKGEKK